MGSGRTRQPSGSAMNAMLRLVTSSHRRPSPAKVTLPPSPLQSARDIVGAATLLPASSSDPSRQDHRVFIWIPLILLIRRLRSGFIGDGVDLPLYRDADGAPPRQDRRVVASRCAGAGAAATISMIELGVAGGLRPPRLPRSLPARSPLPSPCFALRGAADRDGQRRGCAAQTRAILPFMKNARAT